LQDIAVTNSYHFMKKETLTFHTLTFHTLTFHV